MTEVKEGWSIFQRRWAGLHPLNQAGRHEAFSLLQPLSEVLVRTHCYPVHHLHPRGRFFLEGKLNVRKSSIL